MQDDKKEKPKDEKKKKNKYIVKDGDGNIMDVEVPESWIKILEAMHKGEKKKWIPFLKEYCSNIEYVLKFLGKIKKGTEFSMPYLYYKLFIFYFFFLILMDISLTTMKNEWSKNEDNSTAIDETI